MPPEDALAASNSSQRKTVVVGTDNKESDGSDPGLATRPAAGLTHARTLDAEAACPLAGLCSADLLGR